MKSIVIKKTKYGYSSETLESSSNCRLEILADWLLDDVRNNIDFWVELLNDDSEEAESTESNATWLEKDWQSSSDYKIKFGSITHMMLNTKKGIYIPKEDEVARLSKSNVLDLLSTWQKLLKFSPAQIVITEEDGIYKMSEVQ